MWWRVVWQYDTLFMGTETNTNEFETEQQADDFIESLEMNEFVGWIDKELVDKIK